MATKEQLDDAYKLGYQHGRKYAIAKSKHWLDNADSYLCPICYFETDNPHRFKYKCPICGFMDEKDCDKHE